MANKNFIKSMYSSVLIMLCIIIFTCLYNTCKADNKVIANQTSNQCLKTDFTFNTSWDKTSTNIAAQLIVNNFCSWSVDLSRYYINFMSQDIDGNAVGLLALYSVGWPNINPIAYVNFKFEDPDNIRNGRTIGYFINYSPVLNGPLILQPNQSFIAKGSSPFNNKSFQYVFPERNPPISISASQMLGFEETNDISYGRDSLVNIPVGGFGLKTFVVTNYSLSDINAISFSNNLPKDITFDTSRSTCKTDTSQILHPGESCLLIVSYMPQIEGVSSSLTLFAAGMSSELQDIVRSPNQELLYSSRITDLPQPDTQVGPNTQIGITVVTPDSFPYARDSLVNIAVGSSGLKSYTITNTSQVKLYAITLPKLPNDEFNYDWRTTCSRLDNKLMLNPNQSCNIVIRYAPKEKGVSSELKIQVAGVDDYYNVFSNVVFNLPYSSY